uniref:pseudouridine synthase n=1 Tax=Synechococcus sp. UW106 TaxID=368495 RepID=UPI000E0EDE0A|nr:pseudouridine synthase [Synechococcus sp. UW106]
MTRQRLQKLIAAAGLCSRRRAEEWIQAGRITVDGQVARVGDQADPQQQTICVDGRALPSRGAARVLLLNKPVGVICSCDDPQGRRTVLDLLPPEHRAGLHPVGRLDADSRGALLLTDLGELTLKLTHPRYSHAKTYRVWVEGVPSEAVLDSWCRGFPLDGRPTRPAQVRRLQTRGVRSLLEIELREGRNRQIRRMAEALGHPVLDLRRTVIAGLPLGDLAEGCWMWLSEGEWKPMLDRAVPLDLHRPCD